MVGIGACKRCIERPRNQRRIAVPARKAAGRLADPALIVGFAVAQIVDCGLIGSRGLGQTCLGLGNFKLSAFAKLEPIAGRSHLRLDKSDAFLPDFDDPPVGHDVHIGLNDREQHVLLGVPGAIHRRIVLSFRTINGRRGRPGIIQILLVGKPDTIRPSILRRGWPAIAVPNRPRSPDGGQPRPLGRNDALPGSPHRKERTGDLGIVFIRIGQSRGEALPLGRRDEPEKCNDAYTQNLTKFHCPAPPAPPQPMAAPPRFQRQTNALTGL